MAQLHTIVAVERTVRTTAQHRLTELYQLASRQASFSGKHRVYKPYNGDEPDEVLESTLPALTATGLLRDIQELLVRPWDLGATRDASNMTATASIIVDGQVLVEDVPAVTLLSLEQQLTNLRTVLQALPVLSVTEDWEEGVRQGLKVVTSEKPRTRKVMKALILHEGNERHPPQAQAYPDDEVVGRIITTEFSGAIDAAEKDSLVDRVNRLIEAVKAARTVANQAEVRELRVAEPLLSYVFAR